MERLFLTKKQIYRLKRNQEGIEKEFKVRISMEGDNASVEGDSMDEYNAAKAVKALCDGFDLKIVSFLKDEEYMAEEVSISDYAKRQRFKQIRARIIGKEGRVLKTISELSSCAIKLADNRVIIIGMTEDVDIAKSAIVSLIQGSKHSSVYAKLEKKPIFVGDLGLKEKKEAL